MPTSSYHLPTSHALFLHHVRITKAHYGLVHVAFAHHYPSQERWYQGGFMLASEKPDGLGWRDRGCNQERFERPSDGRG